MYYIYYVISKLIVTTVHWFFIRRVYFWTSTTNVRLSSLKCSQRSLRREKNVFFFCHLSLPTVDSFVSKVSGRLSPAKYAVCRYTLRIALAHLYWSFANFAAKKKKTIVFIGNRGRRRPKLLLLLVGNRLPADAPSENSRIILYYRYKNTCVRRRVVREKR